MIKTFKTKTQVLVDSIKNVTDYAYLDVSWTNFDGLTYTGVTEYYYYNGDERVVIERTNPVFTVAEADAIEQMPGGLTGNTLTEQFVDLIVKASLYQFSVGGYFGLTGSDWEVYA